jgi:hypothetical protein
MIPMKLHRWIGRPAFVSVTTLILALLGSICTADASEDVGARSSRAPMSHGFELEPHLVLGTAPPGFGQGSGIGAGARGSVVILRDGFLPKVNDSVALGFGFDYGRYKGDWALNGWRDQCLHYEVAPGGTQICTDVTSNGGTYTYLYLPVVVQWNFWLTRRVSAFGEPGVDLYYLANHGFGAVPALYLGARVQLSDRIALTGRLGYPTSAIGVSFTP